jgi:hypothetical protein
MNKFITWGKARLAEKSTQRSLPAFFGALAAVIYAIVNKEPSSAILAAVTMFYTAHNAITPEA